MTEERVIRNRLALLPPIRRARLWRLYAEARPAGRPWRFLDFWMDDGRSILGAKGTGLGTAAKAAVDTGLTRPFPSVREARLATALLARHPGYAALRFYRNEDRALRAAEALAPGLPVAILRPFSEYLKETLPPGGAASDAAAAQCVSAPRVAMPRLPCPAALAPAVLLFRDAADASAEESDLVPPLGLACAHGSLFELDRFALTYDESLWKKVDRRLGAFFERRGPYLYPRIGNDGYEVFFRAALAAGALISPDPERPSLIPGDFDDGELAALAVALATALGELA
jgi:hypothetical protein